MNREEVKKIVEEMMLAWEMKKKHIGLAIAITAAFLAIATMMSHRAHTEEVVIQGERNTQWANYDRKRSVEHMYESDAKIAALVEKEGKISEEFKALAKIESEGEQSKGNIPAKDGTKTIREKAQKQDVKLAVKQKQAFVFDTAELVLEIAIVLCSVSLLKDSQSYYRGSYMTTGFGAVVLLYGFLGFLIPRFLPTGFYPDWLFP